MINYIICFFQIVGLFDRPFVPRPYKARTTPKGQPRPSQPREPHTSSDGRIYDKIGDETNPEWSRRDKTAKRDPKRVQTLTAFDYQELADNDKLDTDKYAAIKFHWGGGLSNAEIVEKMKNESGFKKRTVETYTPAMSRAVINEFTPSPTAESR